ncbi:hypothetical protein P872_01585 [Rhodonellum psychrophilum GCM71 = DSM 17998]|uniref:DegT/DnrJ/EryC1/StrS aminotransferase family protein n=2 Tax=Rhodonellum TaxID=336827 RepID=U5BTN7_9BACT|nr:MULTISPECIES: DegT/DnrJ/EryC1/StrS family aminotransferase [Rhodonellum]ERM83980.1 hypothetical protein P872_01585 [Rhodonellum psychrophilum GCM71 = DSM 17998]SDZ05947.1 dTDP-4-amino-4,6-dideoxygalactose transaminase [Rhodonellum ikkaensis]
MFVINPDPYSSPCFRIGPFQSKDIGFNFNLPQSSEAEHSFNDKFKNKPHYYTYNGRSAIGLALSHYNLQSDDFVTILTTSGNTYISKCVTDEISVFCNWNREINDKTKVIFVNHEFGYIYPKMKELVQLGIPIIEDCCTTLWSQDEEGLVGHYGDFATYSFPKFFPIQIGGILLDNKGLLTPNHYIEAKTKTYILKVLSHYVKDLPSILEKRRSVFDFGIKLFESIGLSERFERTSLEVPSVMMLKTNGIITDLNSLKQFLWDHGIQSSIFYGEEAFFLPCNQNLSEAEMSYFFEVISAFIRKP